MKILIPIDGSPGSIRALQHVLEMTRHLKESPQLFLLNVQWNLAAGNVKLFINKETINDYYREQGLLALAPAREVLDKAGLAYDFHINVGSPADAIAEYAEQQGIDQIVMGRQGRDSISALLLGSVVNKLLHITGLPVVLVR